MKQYTDRYLFLLPDRHTQGDIRHLQSYSETVVYITHLFQACHKSSKFTFNCSGTSLFFIREKTNDPALVNVHVAYIHVCHAHMSFIHAYKSRAHGLHTCAYIIRARGFTMCHISNGRQGVSG